MPLITDISSLLVRHEALDWIAELYFYLVTLREPPAWSLKRHHVPLYSSSSNWSLQQKKLIRVSIGHNDFAAMQGCFTCAWGDEKRDPDMSDIWPIFLIKLWWKLWKIWQIRGVNLVGVFYVVKWKSEPRFWIFVISLVLWIKWVWGEKICSQWRFIIQIGVVWSTTAW